MISRLSLEEDGRELRPREPDEIGEWVEVVGLVGG